MVKTVKLKKIFRLEFFSSWTVKLLFVIFGRLSYSFLSDPKSNLSAHWVYIMNFETDKNESHIRVYFKDLGQDT